MDKIIDEILNEMQPSFEFSRFFELKREKVVGKGWVFTYADDDAGFEKVFIREFKESNIKSKVFFRDELSDRFISNFLNPLVDHFYKFGDDYRKKHGRDLERAGEFLNYLKALTPETMPKLDEEPLFDEVLISKIHAYSGKAFNPISKSDLFDALNYPEANGRLIIPLKRAQLYGIVKKLEALAGKDWALRMIEAIGIDVKIYSKTGSRHSKSIKFD